MNDNTKDSNVDKYGEPSHFHVQHFIVYFQKSEDLRNQWNLYFVLSWIVSFHAVEKTT